MQKLDSWEEHYRLSKGHGYTPVWIPFLLSDWRGFCCLVLTDDSPRCDLVNQYVEDYWWSLHAQSGNDLLILAVAKAPSDWRDELDASAPSHRLRKLTRRNLRCLDRPQGLARARSTVHAFLRGIEAHNRTRIRLPALALFRWSEQDALAAIDSVSSTDRVWEKYPSLADLSVLELPSTKTLAEIQKVFDSLLAEVRASAGDFEALRARIRLLGWILRIKVTAGSLFCLFERLAPLVK